MEKRNFQKLEKRLTVIIIFTVLAASGLYVLFFSWDESFKFTQLTEEKTGMSGLTATTPEFRQRDAMDWESIKQVDEAAGETRSLREYYARRAFLGAPPFIPHPVKTKTDCLACHENGGYVAKWGRYTPMTPHPEFAQCTQCHVDQKSRPNSGTAVGFAVPKLKGKELAFFPATVPHEVRTRKNCFACHGPGAPREIRSPHPERSNCTQCHVEQTLKVEE